MRNCWILEKLAYGKYKKRHDEKRHDEAVTKYYDLLHTGCGSGPCQSTICCGSSLRERQRLDLKKACRILQKAADRGYAAQFNLALCYKHAEGVKKDLKKAIKYYTLAAGQDHAAAQLHLAICYAHGEGVKKDLKNAFKYCKLAADQGNAAAQCNLGISMNMPRAKKNLTKAAEYCLLSADQGHAKAQCNLGVCYKNGTGVEKDLKKAAEYYTLAADQGNAKAQIWIFATKMPGVLPSREGRRILHTGC